MKIHLLVFTVLILIVSTTSFSFDFDDVFDNLFSKKFEKTLEKLRSKTIKLRQVLNETIGHWKELDADNDDLFDAAIDELRIHIKNQTDRSIKRRKFSKNLELADKLTNKHKHAFFGITPFSFVDLDDFKKVCLTH